MYPILQRKSSACILQDLKAANGTGEEKVQTTYQTALTVLPHEHTPVHGKHGSRVAIRCRPRVNTRIAILAVTLPLSLYPMASHFVTCIHATFSILTYIFEAITKLAQLHKRLHDTRGFHHFPHDSAWNSC